MNRYFLPILILSAVFIVSCSGTKTVTTAKPSETATPAATATPAVRQVEIGDSVKVHYTLTLDDGTEVESSVGGTPLEFTAGAGQMIAGFDHAVVGMSVGESKTVRIPPEEAYGPYQEELVQEVPRDMLPPELELEIGAQLQAQRPDGQLVLFTVIEVTESTVTLDANHHLAGEYLTFNIELVEIE
jgi:peptidylprolyl isomerase